MSKWWFPCALLLAPLPAQIIFVPAPTFPPTSPGLPAAIAAAPPGAVLVLGPGLHLAGGVVDKPLTIEAPTGTMGAILVSDSDPFGLSVTSLGSGGRVMLRNIRFLRIVFSPTTVSLYPATLQISLPAPEVGSVVLDNLTVEGVRGPGAVISTGPDVSVVIRDCAFHGADGTFPVPLLGGDVGGDGARVTAAGECWIERSQFFAGDGGDTVWIGPVGPQPPAFDGGSGLLLSAPRAVLVDCAMVDGDGGRVLLNNYSGSASPCPYMGQGGVSQVSADVFDVAVQNGTDGWTPNCAPTQPPPPLALGTGRQDLRVPSAQQIAGSPYTIDVRIIPPAQGFTLVAYGLAPRQVSLPFLVGNSYLDQVLFLDLVLTSAGGWQPHPFPAVSASLAIDADVFLQVVHLDFVSGVIHAGTPASTTIFPVGR